MKLQFGAKQAYQVDAVSAVVDHFDGQPLNKPDYATILQTFDTELFGSVGQTDLGIGNKLIIVHSQDRTSRRYRSPHAGRANSGYSQKPVS